MCGRYPERYIICNGNAYNTISITWQGSIACIVCALRRSCIMCAQSYIPVVHCAVIWFATRILRSTVMSRGATTQHHALFLSSLTNTYEGYCSYGNKEGGRRMGREKYDIWIVIAELQSQATNGRGPVSDDDIDKGLSV